MEGANLSTYDESINFEKYCLTRNIIITDRPQSVPYKRHRCNVLCMSRVLQYRVDPSKYLSALSIPLYFGFKRYSGDNNDKIHYRTPCGRVVKSEAEMYRYLNVTKCDENQMTIDLFSFDYRVNPLAMFETPFFIVS